MPQRRLDPFYDPTQRSDRGINPFFTEMVDKQSRLPLLYGESLATAKGHWRELIATADSAKKIKPRLFLEVGCYKGRTLIELAEKNPHEMFVGFDITFKRVVLSAQRILRKGLPNAAVGLANINPHSFQQLFADGELDGVMVFFPDPWSKKRKQRHRLIQPEFVARVVAGLKSGGFLWLKTDQSEYFAAMRMAVETCQELSLVSEVPEIGRNLEPTSFESTFLRQGIGAHSATWIKH